ncbi:MAG: SbcC/MukB-like Walker B domain-containing protein [Candidatus Sericytochromatia bacterium]
MLKKKTINPYEAGFRLQYLEIYNWGTFDNKIFKIEPSGENSLLTGANGSGKTTLVDAILTLIVPDRRLRFYNQSSGTQNKKERDEESYVRGFYGKILEESTQNTATQMLRPDKEKVFSVLLANFYNEYSEQNLTLAQVRWFSGNDLKRVYILCHQPLNIIDDIKPFDSNGLWKRRLKSRFPARDNKEIIEFFDSSSKYSHEFRKVFGMRSEKALTLFNQTVGIKVLGSLDDFIRHHMLEETNIEEDFIKLKENYHSLLNAHKTIEKAKQQIDYLEKVKKNNDELEEVNQKLNEIYIIKNILVPYFCFHLDNLLKNETEVKNNELKQVKAEIETIKNDLEAKRETEKEIDFNIKSDETGKQIKDLDRDIREKNKVKNNIDSNVRKYNKLAESLRFDTSPSKELFYENMEGSKKRKDEYELELSSLEKRYLDLMVLKTSINSEKEQKIQELRRLETQKNNITGKIALIRELIISAVSAEPEEIPFIGELIQVKNKNLEWESVIEKVLHSFALRLLVPERYYNQVNNFVNNNDIGGRIVYHKVESKSINRAFIKVDENSLLSKIEIKPDSEYFDWIEEHISSKYNYICADDPIFFSKCSKAITKNGLIKNDNRHEKDDRPEVLKKENFILGWDNKEKIKINKDILKSIEKRISELDSKIVHLEKERRFYTKENEYINLFLNFEDFEEINWQKLSIEIQELEDKKKSLETTSNKIKELNEQLKSIKDEIKQIDNLLISNSKEESRLENYINDLDIKLFDNKKLLITFDKEHLSENFSIFEEYFKKENLTLNLKNIDDINKKLSNKIDYSLERQKELQNLSIDNLRLAMREFKNPSDPEITKKFPDWRNDTYQLSDDNKYVGEYLEIFDKLNKDELPQSQQRFKKYLNEDMINKLADFQTIMNTQEEQIIDNIEALNNSLKRINFRNNPPTYIQIKENTTNSQLILDFKASLKDWKPNISEYEKTKNEDILEKSFLKIQSIIEDLTNNENKRKEVTDVRNWFRFSAREHFREDNKLFKIYESTGELSGGEKAQLTYTILGSSIAYQFGINKEGNENKSFRFITVDESFSNQDDEKATYLMDLCKQLHLQLLVVTPNDKTHIVEPYISHVHFTQRQNNRNSLLFDMPISDYIEERERFIDN